MYEGLKRAAEPIKTGDVAGLMAGYSLEATAPSDSDIQALKEVLPEKRDVYLSAIHGRPTAELIAAAVQVRKVGLEPVPHIVGRGYSSHEELQHVLKRLCGEAGVRKALVLAGDIPVPAGPFVDALSVIVSDHLQKAGIAEIGVSSYPDGHPQIGNGALQAALMTKLVAARARGLRAHIVSQFCFDADRILAWLRELRAQNITAPIRIGLAGPTSIKKLMRYALKCGVRTSAKAMFSTQAAQLLSSADPTDLLAELAGSPDLSSLGELHTHIFSFGGLASTGAWAEGFSASEAVQPLRGRM